MKYFEIEYIKNGAKNTITLPYSNKLEAIQGFKSKTLGVFLNINEISEPISIKLSRLKDKIKDKLRAKRVPLEPYIASLRQISTMLNAGLPITTCLEDAVGTTEHKRIKEIYVIVLQEVESGVDLSNAFKGFEDEVGAISIAMLDLGEKTGMLDESIDKLADILQEVHDNRMKLKKATRYPMIVIVVMIIAFSLVITLVVPQFQSMFEEYHAKLPFPTILLLWIEHAIVDYGPYIIAGAAIISVILSALYKRNQKFKLNFDRYMLKVYIVGKVIYLSMIGRFVYVFDRLSSSGIPMIDALGTAINIVENSYLRKRLSEIIDAIEEGRSLKEGFEDTKQFESMIIQMISAGESSGSLGKMLDKISDIFRKKYNYLVDNVSTMIEPLLIAAIAGFVLLLALGIFLPMWSIAEAVGN